MNRLFVVKKPLFISSNKYLNKIKKQYNTKKAGFSGTLDPFATGTLIVGLGQYTKLFRFLSKTPKTYIATIWIGAISKSLDIENIIQITPPQKAPKNLKQKILDIFDNITGAISYMPPNFSAKKIDGVRAYKLAQKQDKVDLKQITSTIYDIKLLNLNYPFITFQISVSEGSYIRSIAQIILDKLNLKGTLSYLHRVNEGKFIYNNHQPLNPLQYLKIPTNIYTGDISYIKYGKKLSIDYFKIKDDGEYVVDCKEFFSIIQIKNFQVRYLLNSICYDEV